MSLDSKVLRLEVLLRGNLGHNTVALPASHAGHVGHSCALEREDQLSCITDCVKV